jgi:hypothetical protein
VKEKEQASTEVTVSVLGILSSIRRWDNQIHTAFMDVKGAEALMAEADRQMPSNPRFYRLAEKRLILAKNTLEDLSKTMTAWLSQF